MLIIKSIETNGIEATSVLNISIERIVSFNFISMLTYKAIKAIHTLFFGDN